MKTTIADSVAKALCVCIVSLLLATSSGRAAGLLNNLVVNGSFESGTNPSGIAAPNATAITGWVVQSGSIDYVDTWGASDGSRSLDLSGEGPGTISQVISGFSFGQAYRLSFLLAGNPAGGPTVKTVRVSIGGVSHYYTFDVTGFGIHNMGWTQHTLDFTASGSTLALIFASLTDGNFGPALDGVSIPATVPVITLQPASQALQVGDNVTFSMTAIGSSPLGYQWRKDELAMVGQNGSSLSLINVQASDAGRYDIVVTNVVGTVTSQAAILRLVNFGAPEIQVSGEMLFENVTRGAPSTISISTAFPSGTVFYTTDGSSPTFASTPYVGPFVITQSISLKAIAYSSDFTQSAEDGPFQIQIVPTYAITASVTGQGTVASFPKSSPYTAGTVVTLSAIPFAGWRFVRWQGDACGSGTDISVFLDANKTVTAIFEAIPIYALSATTAGGGTISGNTGSPYAEGSVVNLTAQPSPGWQFLGWQGDASGTIPNVAVTIDRAKNVQAVFGTLVNTTIGGAGTVTPSPAQGPYPYGSTVRMYARPSGGSYFAVWGSAASGRVNPLDFIVTNANPTISALFAPLQGTEVNIYVNVNGEGTVAAAPNLQPYSPGTPVTLTAMPSAGWRFVEWQGDAGGNSTNATVVLNVNKVVTAVFEVLPRYTLTTTTPGGGFVLGNTGSPYAEGSVVNLTAQPSPGWQFLGWQGDASGTIPNVAVTIDRAKNVQAIFGTASVITNVVGSGTVTLDPGQGPYPYGSTVRLAAAPGVGSYFAFWGNAASGTANPLDFVITTANPAICALFAPLGSSLVITCPANLTTNTAPDTCWQAVNYMVSASGNVPVLTTNCTPLSGSIFAKGVTTVTCTATDAHSNSATCNFTVTVNDTEPPTITCPPNQTSESVGDFAPVFGEPSLSDACDTNVSVTFVDAELPANCPAVRVFRRTWTATDDDSNRATCSQTLTFVDSTPPVIVCASDRTVECGIAWMFDAPSAFDTHEGTNVSVRLVSTLTNVLCGRTLTATRTWLAIDSCSNSSVCSQTITVVDTTPPLLLCPPDRTVDCRAAWTFDMPVASDLCDGTNVSIRVLGTETNILSGTGFVATRTWEATDPCSNLTTCHQTITVRDATPPAVVCPSNQVLECTSPQGALAFFTSGAADDCDTNLTVNCSPSSGTVFPLGTNTVTCCASDSSRNSNTCSFFITVRDTMAPVIACTTNLAVECASPTGTPVHFSSSTTDLCDTNPVVVCTPASGSLFPLGATPVSCTATDASGNQSSCSFAVDVRDTTPPEVLCLATVATTIPCGHESSVVTFEVQARDNCDPNPVVACVPPSGSRFHVGATFVFCTATDAAGRSNDCSFRVLVCACSYRLITQSQGGGGGEVRKEPVNEPYPACSLVTVTAAAATNWTFLGWLGDAEGSNTVTSVEMTRTKCVQGVFGTRVSAAVIGNGSVSNFPAAEFYPYGSTIRFTALPQPGYYFVRWTNEISSTANPLDLLVTRPNDRVSTIFAPLPTNAFALTVIIDGNGRLSRRPSSYYSAGTSVTNVPVPEGGQAFVGWSGDTNGAMILGSNLVLRIDDNKTITAHFTRRPRLDLMRCEGRLREDGFQMMITGWLGERYVIESNTSLDPTELTPWVTLGKLTNSLGAAQFLDPYTPVITSRFYRVRLLE